MESSTSRLSFVKGPTEPPLWHLTLGSLTDKQAARYGDRPAVIVPWQNARLSYRQLAARSWMVAEALFKLGIRHGDCVGILAGNRFEYLEAFLGASRLGCPVVVLNTTYTPFELQNALHKSCKCCKVLFAAASIGSRTTHQHINQLRGHSTPGSPLPDLRHIILFDKASEVKGELKSQLYPSFMSTASVSAADNQDLKRIAQSVTPEDVINLQFTSGTTGDPKAAMLSSFNIVNNGRFIGDALHLTEHDIVCCPPPLFHCFGLVLGFMACFTHGSSIILPSDSFDASQVLQSITHESATVLYGVPTMFVAELEIADKIGWAPKTLRLGLSAGSAMPAALGKKLAVKMGLDKVLIGYGMTETSPVTFLTDVEDSLERRLNSIGRIIPHAMGKVIDSSGNILPRGQRGELCTAGFGLQKGYWRNQAKTDEVMKKDKDGVLWMHTGDEVYIDDEGYAYITGRIKDMIIRGGENIFPREIEERLLEHPSIAEASVVGINDEKYGEVVGAFLRLAPAAKDQPQDEEIRAWAIEKLGRHKTPRYIFWVGAREAVADYPKTGSGKYQKHLLRDIGNRLVKQNIVKSKL
ncbi:hypothetical protein EDB81DRAFT_898353 [Dactylonectria macrodidyma]|uniref:Uncharacterized protein n=1 Tax=Dactylonectria macrodidyma TaxID=307937 RepID=A0A9P9FUE7_9HYPO|nr:hypothetical protein EDB81DRAFT_898353 [Dactylonectria macrodidyma]